MLLAAAAAGEAAASSNSLALSVEPAVPKVDRPFQVRATGTVSATESGNVMLIVVLGPADRRCSSSGALEQSQGEQAGRSEGWAVWWDSFLGGTRPMATPYDEAKVFDGRQLGRYRICAYTIGQGEGPDPYVATTLDLTVGGTCAAATRRTASARRLVPRRQARLKSARKLLRKARGTGSVRRLKAARRGVAAKKKALKKARARLAKGRAVQKALCP